MAEIVVMIVGIILLAELPIVRVENRVDAGTRPTGEIYDTRRPE